MTVHLSITGDTLEDCLDKVLQGEVSDYFELGQPVIVVQTGVDGHIVERTESLHTETRYIVALHCGASCDGDLGEFYESELIDVSIN